MKIANGRNLALGGILVLGGAFLLYRFHYVGYAILALAIGVVFLAAGVFSLFNHRTPAKRYESEIRSILNTYDSILVKSNGVPNIEGRNIIVVESIDDLIDAQLEIRKPICYVKQTESCSFVLLDEKEAYIYVEKLTDDVLSPVEIAVQEAKIKQKSKEEMDSEMLRDIEKTTVVKLSNKRSYKVSPIRKKQKDLPEKEQQDEKVVEELLEDMEVPKEEKKKKSFFKQDNFVVETLDFDDEKFAKTEILDEIELL